MTMDPAKPPSDRTIIIGVGNEFRRDDGAGLFIAHRLNQQLQGQVEVLFETGEGTALMDAWQGAIRVFLIDGMQAGAPPGTICRLDAHQASLSSKVFRSSTHQFGVAEAVELARILKRLPDQLIIYGIEIRNVEPGIGVCPEIEAAAHELMRLILEEISLL